MTNTDKQVAALREQKDAAYKERDSLVCALSKLFPSWIGRHDPDDLTWDNDWRWIVFVQLPTGQCSWHIHDSELPWFDHCKRSGDAWDGHSTEEKYRRVEALAAHQPAPASPPVTDAEIEAAIDDFAEAVPQSDRIYKPARKALRALIARLVAQEAAAAEIRVGRLVLAIETVRRFENHAERDESLIRRCWVEVGDALAAFRAARAVG